MPHRRTPLPPRFSLPPLLPPPFPPPPHARVSLSSPTPDEERLGGGDAVGEGVGEEGGEEE